MEAALATQRKLMTERDAALAAAVSSQKGADLLAEAKAQLVAKDTELVAKDTELARQRAEMSTPAGLFACCGARPQ